MSPSYLGLLLGEAYWEYSTASGSTLSLFVVAKEACFIKFASLMQTSLSSDLQQFISGKFCLLEPHVAPAVLHLPFSYT